MTNINLPQQQVKAFPNGASNMYQAGTEISKNNNEQLNNLTKVGGKKKRNKKTKKQKGGQQNNNIPISPLNAKFPEQSTGSQSINGNNQAINELYAKAQVNATYDNCINGQCGSKIGGKKSKYILKKKSNLRFTKKSKSKSKSKSKNKKYKLFGKLKSKQLSFVL